MARFPTSYLATVCERKPSNLFEVCCLINSSSTNFAYCEPCWIWTFRFLIFLFTWMCGLGVICFPLNLWQNEMRGENWHRNVWYVQACRWNGKLYYDGDHWKENGVDFYCSSSDRKVRPGCYIENRRVKCTGAIPGWCKHDVISINFFCSTH